MLLLLSLGLLLVALPIFKSAPGGGIRFWILLCLVLLAAIYVSSTERWMFISATLVGGGAIGSAAIAEWTGATHAQVIADLLGLLLLSFTTLLIVNTLIHTERVSRDTVIGGICVYLLVE